MQDKNDLNSIRNKEYYFLAHKGSKDLTHPAMLELVKLAKNSNYILDLGCGEGTRINSLKNEIKNSNAFWFGIDINKFAIKKAKKKYPTVKFTIGNLEKLPFKNNEFDLIFSAYVFEHLMNPKKVLEEAKRVLKVDGKFLIVAPNFGSPNRRSPNSKEMKLMKIFRGFLKDFQRSETLNWNNVTPRTDKYTIDSDTTAEPYLGSLISYCKSLGFKISLATSLWDVDIKSFNQVVFKSLGKLGIYPFKYWGPHLLIVLEKK